MNRRTVVRLVLAGLATAPLAACGDTLKGFKQDARDNRQKTGQKLARLGEKIQRKGN